MTEEALRLAREIDSEAARIERYCDYVKTSVDHEPDSIGADFREIVDSCREIDVLMMQLYSTTGPLEVESTPQAPTPGGLAETVQSGFAA